MQLWCHYENTPIQLYTENFTIKNWKFSDKTSDIFHISAQNIECGYSLEPPRRGVSNEYPQSIFLTRNKKNNVYPYKPQFYYIKVGFKIMCFRNVVSCHCMSLIVSFSAWEAQCFVTVTLAW